MPRVNIYAYADSEFDETDKLVGWFNTDSATLYEEAVDWDGHNNVSVHTGQFSEHQALYLTKRGKWVLSSWSQYEGRPDRYEYITPEQAQTWLIRNNDDDAIREHFGEMEEEAGPNLGGRPSEGTKIEARLPDDLLARLEQRARDTGVKRAEMVRRLLTTALQEDQEEES